WARSSRHTFATVAKTPEFIGSARQTHLVSLIHDSSVNLAEVSSEDKSQPVLKTYMTPFITSRTSTIRLLPPGLAGGIRGAICAHSSSVRSLGYRNRLRS